LNTIRGVAEAALLEENKHGGPTNTSYKCNGARANWKPLKR